MKHLNKCNPQCCNNNLFISFQSHGVTAKNIKICHLMSKCEVHKKLSQVKIKIGENFLS